MRRSILLVVLTSLSLLACGRADAPPTPEPPTPAPPKATTAPEAKTVLTETKFGSPITEQAMTPLATLVADPSQYTDKTVRIEGVVKSVCQSRGCWMQIGDEKGAAHIKFAGYGFFVPKNASGHRAVVQGKLVPSKDSCAGKDGCREAGEKASGVVAKVDFEATGVEFVN